MSSKACISLVVLGLALPWLLAGSAVMADIVSDRKECTVPMTSLAPCLPYVQGMAPVPTKNCCGGMSHVLDTNRKCLCLLIENSDSPEIGFQFNASQALRLPGICQIPANITECLDLLNISPNSPDANLFKQNAGSLSPVVSSPATTGTEGDGSSSSASGWSDQSGRNLGNGRLLLLTGWVLMFAMAIWN